MSYFTNFQDPQEIKNLLLKKEYAVFAKSNEDQNRWLNKLIMEPYIVKEGNLVLHSHQRFVANWMYPNTPFSRLLVKHSTGSGKTLLALNVANNFIKYFQTRFDISDQGYAPTIYIVGFVRQNFQKELMTRPEFGFVTKKEVEDYERLKFIADTGSKKDRDNLTDFESKIKKRFSKRTHGGFYKFLGYKELFNKLFVFDENPAEAEFGDDGGAGDGVGDGVGDARTNIISILRALKSGKAKINMEFLDTFANSLLICDEIHNTYNSVNINNYGTAIQIILDIFDSPEKMDKIVKLRGKTVYGTERMSVLRNSNVRAIYMSATPINNNPTEVIDLINLLVPWSSLPEGRKIIDSDLFSDGVNLKPDALHKVGVITRGYVSFLRDENPALYPEKIFVGESIRLPASVKSKTAFIPYLKFTRCPISDYHYKTYKKVYTGSLPPDGQTLVDMVIPNPGIKDVKEIDPSIGLFRSRDIKYALMNAPTAWKNKNNINYVKQSISGSTTAFIISGEFWSLGNIDKYSSKYAKLMRSVIDNLRTDGGKIIISHQYVKISGVLGLQELMRRNGVIDEFSSPNPNTLCSICGKRMAEHKSANANAHEFKPARFMTLYGDLDRNTLDRSIGKFNRPDNANGYNFRIIIGSAVLNEALDFNSVRNLWIVSAPPDISTLIQIIGRGYRSKSALLLPPEKRTLSIQIFVSSLPKSQWKSDLFYEEKKYYEKVRLYEINQLLDKKLNENAIDGPINYNRIFRGNEKPDQLGPLKYDIPDTFSGYWQQVASGKRKVRVSDLQQDTFNVWHNHEELDTIIYIIKRIFIEQSAIWTYESLWKMVRNPPFELAVNAQLFDEDNFKLALHMMSDTDTVDAYNILMKSSGSTVSRNPVDRLFNHLDRRVVFPNGDEAQIKFIDGYYILFPVKSSDIMDSGLPQLGMESTDLIGYPDVDIDSWYRHDDGFQQTSINITNLLKTSQISYSQMKYKFYKSFRNVPIQAMPISAEIYDVNFHKRLLEDSIRYAFNVLTNRDFPVSELHDFYFKMIYFYDRLEMILFASHLQENGSSSHYAAYTSKPDPKINPYALGPIEKGPAKGKIYNAFLITSIAKNSLPEKLNFDKLNEFISRTKDVASATAKSRRPGYQPDVGIVSADPGNPATTGKKSAIVPVPSNMLPVGHFLNNDDTEVTIPFLYDPQKDDWQKAPEFVRSAKAGSDSQVENNTIIGYYEKVPNGIEVKFKTRSPIQKIVKHSDTRLIESGAACDNKRKEEIIELLKLVGIVRTAEMSNIRELCELLKIELMKRELLSRQKARHGNGPHERWFYMHFEKQPDL